MHGFGGIVNLFVGITIAVIMVASVVLPTVFSANQTGWDTGTVAMYSIIGIAVVASLILMII